MQEKKHVDQSKLINYIKAFCIISVLLIHCNFSFETKANTFIFRYILNMAIPIFLIIFGYNISNSYIRRSCDTFKKLYDLKYFAGKLVRLGIPFLLCYVVLKLFNYDLMASRNGVYYFFVILQFLLLMPLIYSVVKKFVPNFCGVFLFFVAGMLWDSIVSTCEVHVSMNAYMYYCFRYLFYPALGVYLALNKSRIKPGWLISSFVLGVLYLSNISFGSNNSHLIYPWVMGTWALTASPVGFYLFPIMYLVLTYMKDFKIPGSLGKCFETIGKASWHIYLFQLAYYHITDRKYDCFLNLLVCCIAGWIFYKASNIISSRLKNIKAF